MKNKTFQKGMLMLGTIARTDFSKQELETFRMLLDHLGDDDFMNAVGDVTSKETFYPTTNYVALILNAVKSKNTISPAEAWGQLIDYASGKIYENEIDENALKAFGGLGFAFHSIAQGRGFEATPEKLGYMRREFIQFYKEYSASDATKQKLIGGSDANARIGDGFQKIGGK